jgi:hypothetical protein
LKPQKAVLASLYFAYAAYIVYGIIESYVAALQPNTFVPGLLVFSIVFLIFAAMWAGFGVLELRGHHDQNIFGSILSMMFLAALGIFQDATIDVSAVGLLVILVVLVTAMLALNDLRASPGKRTFPAVLSVDALLLILFSMIATYPKRFSDIAAIVGPLGTLVGIGMLGFGLFRLVRPRRSFSAQIPELYESTPKGVRGFESHLPHTFHIRRSEIRPTLWDLVVCGQEA